MLIKKFGSPEKPIEAPSKIETPKVEGMIVPSLEEFGIDVKQLGEILYPGGETEGLKRMDR